MRRAVAEQLRCPRGAAGRLAGRAMAVVNRRAYAAAIAGLDVKDGERVLEVGAGPGSGLKALAASAPAVRVWGIDASPEMLRQAVRRTRAERAAGRVRIALADFEALPFPDGHFDAVLAVNVAYFWRTRAALDEILRVLRPGGRLSVYVTHRDAMEAWGFSATDTHLLYTEPSLRLAFVQAGFGAARIRIAQVSAGFGVTGLCAVAERARTANPGVAEKG